MEDKPKKMTKEHIFSAVLIYAFFLTVKPLIQWLKPHTGLVAAQSAGYMWAFLTLSGYFYIRNQHPKKYFETFKWSYVGSGFLWGLFLFVIGGIGYALTSSILGTAQEASMLGDISGFSTAEWAGLFGNQVVVVFSEEVAFRGILLSVLTDLGSGWTGILGSSLLFSVYHLSAFQLLSNFLIGCGLAYITFKKKSVWPALIAHFVYNLIGLSLAAAGMAG